MLATNLYAPIVRLGGVDFEMCGYIWPKGEIKSELLPQVLNVRVGQKCSSLHFIHNCARYTNCPDGTLVGAYIVHYAPGEQAEIPLVYGDDLRDWGDTDTHLSRASAGWAGINDNGVLIRLVKWSWKNPHPDLEITSIDLISKTREFTPILFALTAEK
jgi:hypothetical protein